jgi:DNA-binding XRE family transcriptional regulator
MKVSLPLARVLIIESLMPTKARTKAPPDTLVYHALNKQLSRLSSQGQAQNRALSPCIINDSVSVPALEYCLQGGIVKVLHQRLLYTDIHPARLRREIGMTQLDLSETLGVHRTTIQNWERRGEITVKPALLVMLVMAGRHPLYKRCLGDDGKPPPLNETDRDWPFSNVTVGVVSL